MMLQQRRSRVVASPRARRAMRSRGVDPALVRGSGPGGRIVEADVFAAAETFGRAAAGSGDPRRALDGEPRWARAGHVSNVPAAMGTLETCPTFWLQATADVTSLLEIQAQIAEEVRRKCGTPLRLAHFILRAMSLALADCPQANRAWQGDTCVALPTVNVGFELGLPGGRIATVIARADRLQLLELISRRAELTAAAQAGRLPPDAVGLAATALCDLTDYRIDRCGAALLPPRTSVLAVGGPTTAPGLVGNRSGLRQSLCVTMTADQRAVTLETAAAFLGRIVELLERPFLLLCERLPR